MMVKIPVAVRLIGVAFFLIILPVPGHALTPGQVFNNVKNTVLVVKTLDARGKLKAQGSGVLLSFGRVATNCHVVEGGASYQVARGEKLVSATLYAEDGDKDICILDAKGIEGKPAQLGKTSVLKVGDPVYAVGAPKGLELSLSDGIVAQLRGGPPPLIQSTAAISPGSSGGGLFDGEGRLIGLTTLYIDGGQSLNFAMPVEWIGEVKPGRKLATEGHRQAEWLKRTIALEKMRDWQGLLDLSLEWTKSEPSNAQAWYHLGITYYDLDRYDDAIDAYRQSLRIDPKNAPAWTNLGAIYINLKRYDDTIEACLNALQIAPENAKAWYNLGFACSHIKRYDEAIEAYRQALRIGPELAKTWFNLGDIYFVLKRYHDAIAAYRNALRIDPEYAETWYKLGISYVGLKRYDDAIVAYREALRINPADATTWYMLACSYGLSGNRTAALGAVRELKRLDPARADALFNVIVPPPAKD